MARILIVEDDLTFGTMIQTWLKKKGFEVDKATSVGAAQRLWQDSPCYDLILSDLRLPDHDGLDLLEWLHRQGVTVPFIVMTSYAEVQNAVHAMKMGATDYVAKPFPPDVLLDKIREAIGKKSEPKKEENRQEDKSTSTTPIYRRRKPCLATTIRICQPRGPHPHVGIDIGSQWHGQGIRGAPDT